MKETMYDFPSRLKILRDKYGYTQSELAKKLSITRASVNAWKWLYLLHLHLFLLNYQDFFTSQQTIYWDLTIALPYVRIT